MSVTGFLFAYVLGGLTFIPLVLIVVLLHAHFTLPIRKEEARPEFAKEDDLHRTPQHAELGSSDLENLPPELKTRTHVPDVAAGYFAVCREYVPGGINGKPPERTTPAGSVVAAESPSVYQSMYRSIFDRNKTLSPSLDRNNGKSKRARNVFYVVLRLGYLMLYDDSEQLEVRHVLSVANFDVDIYAGGEPIPEGELWIKRNCIRLCQKATLGPIRSDSKPFYLFSENCSEKEDFYHAMLASQDHTVDSLRKPPVPLGFDTSDLLKLVQQLHASEENMHTRWINALIGRVFLALYKTSELENFIRTKITKKIARVPKPALISNIQLRNINLGHLPPVITNPKLRELTVDGDLTVEADVSYKGEFRIDISAIARIDLGQRFKAREVTLVLATILKKLEGHVLFKIKPPPSNRMWMTFETAPKMELSLEPIVSSRQITYGLILRVIESRIREVVSETLVFPNWDDFPFSDTASHSFRGGIWAPNTMGSVQTPGDTIEHTVESDKHSETEDTHQQIGESELKEAAKSMPNLANRRKSSSSKSTKTTASALDGADSEPLAVTTSTDFKPRSVPRAMRTGSFASAATPVVSMDPANASTADNEVGERRQDAATTMLAMSQSQPTSPAETPIGSPSRPILISQGSRRRSTSPAHMQSGIEDESEDMADQSSISSKPTATLSTSTGSADSPRSSATSFSQIRSKHTSSISLPRNAFGSAEKRQTLNQSLNSATAAAKKWFAARQNPDSPSSPMFGAAPLGSPAHPIGRGQPLPPPGTPLPGPTKSRTSGWTVPTAATFANLAKRKPVPPKSPQPAVDNDTSQEHTTTDPSTLPQVDTTDMPPPLPEPPAKARRKSSTRSDASGRAEKPPPLPARRKRVSISNTSTMEEDNSGGLFVVEAPLAESSAPSSPALERVVHDTDTKVLRDLDNKEEKSNSEEEGVFEGMDMEDGVAS
ncbi:hypothetical protein EJ04DRAFT_492204 [Polyplosphaeria fusca]|uniref:SMP-LTD domain-containing protein n=1 Tax=Polyplosphaeria fusca TaxID=682080 RepID=A0A9P4V3G6_9PLEO|nr:hypothetical protein EJ04DRAFT_492204 [Polyplosphaeria fusca]